MADQSGLGRTRADGSRDGQTFRADTVVTHTSVGIAEAEFPFEHLPHPLAERELIHLRFDSRNLAAQKAFHKPSVPDPSCVRPELEGSCGYQTERQRRASPRSSSSSGICRIGHVSCSHRSLTVLGSGSTLKAPTYTACQLRPSNPCAKSRLQSEH
jgi:hypothetical protein